MTPTPHPYPAYRPSHGPWLGDVPEHWELRRLRSVSAVPIGNGVGERAQAFRDDWPRYIRITDIAGPRVLDDSKRASLPPEIAKEALIEVGDVLLAAVGATYGKSYIYGDNTGEACFAGYLVRFRPNEEVEPKFFSYWTESDTYWHQIHSGVIQSTIQNFSASRYKGLSIPLPPVPEQRAIVRYLDYVDRRIRRYVSRQAEGSLRCWRRRSRPSSTGPSPAAWTPTCVSSPPASSGSATCRSIGKCGG